MSTPGELPTTSTDEILIVEAAGILGVSTGTVYSMVRDGRLIRRTNSHGGLVFVRSELEATRLDRDERAHVDTIRDNLPDSLRVAHAKLPRTTISPVRWAPNGDYSSLRLPKMIWRTGMPVPVFLPSCGGSKGIGHERSLV
ncbi:helix-turn-helix domain-containing protein [Candidatus Saccharibacteria bacterium]|nr:helix-turn-helix domain-containing protein [Candidatus Saccharibacteria bacterium]